MTGGIAVGKTVMMNYWKSQYDIPIFDLDDVGRDLLKDEGLKKSISVIFGLEVFNESGDIDRLSLQSRIFSNKDEKISQSLFEKSDGPSLGGATPSSALLPRSRIFGYALSSRLESGIAALQICAV